MNKYKIGLVGAIDFPISKNANAGTEIWTYNFGEQLIASGQDVTLFASEGSEFSGKIQATVKHEQLVDKNNPDGLSKPKLADYSIDAATKMAEQANNFDLIHLSVFFIEYYLPLTRMIKKPIVLTVHGTQFSDQEMGDIFAEYGDINYVLIAEHFTKKWSLPKKYRVIHNGIKIDEFSFSDQKEDYFLFIGRICKEKGVEDAIKFSQESKTRLIIAGSKRNSEYFEEFVKPHLNSQIQYVGEVSFREKIKYYQNAKALLMPIKWDEPFGLVVVEAMACGTPVLAYNRGAMPEIIDNGKDGYLVESDSIEGLIKSANRLKDINLKLCREKVENKFTLDLMTSKYLDYYQEIMS